MRNEKKDVCLTLENVSKVFAKVESDEVTHALQDVSVTMKSGEFVSLVGPSGCGKSTILRLVAGLILPTLGRVTVDGAEVETPSPERGVVFQNPDNQMVASIVEDDVAFGPENLGVPREEIGRRITDALTAVNMLEYRRATPHNMSGGQKQRIAIAGILAMKPRVIVLDESTSMLDPAGRRDVMNVVKKLNKEEGITVVHITHHMDEIVDCDRVIVMKDGSKVFEDSPKELFKQDVSQYKLTLPLINQIYVKLKERGAVGEADVLHAADLIDAICR